MTTLDSPAVSTLLARLYTEAEQNDRRLRRDREDILSSADGRIDEKLLTPLLNQMFMEVSPEVGRLLYLLAVARRPECIVEFGTSFGLSTIHLAAALRDSGRGRLITTELCAEKAQRAAAHFQQSGLSALIELRHGDAFETLKNVGPIDMLMLDGWKPLYLPLLKQLEPMLTPACLIVADDVVRFGGEVAPYLDFVRDQTNGYVSSLIPLGDGVELSIRCG